MSLHRFASAAAATDAAALESVFVALRMSDCGRSIICGVVILALLLYGKEEGEG